MNIKYDISPRYFVFGKLVKKAARPHDRIDIAGDPRVCAEKWADVRHLKVPVE
jgi:hypothetical protein